MTGVACLFALLSVQAAAPDEVAALLAQARAATARYHDADAARADGYRPVGPDFPAMGQHWINVGLLVSGTLDPARPAILEYAELNGRLSLVGVAYAALSTGGVTPTALPVPPDAWHLHSGTLTEESFLRGHTAGEHPEHGPAVAVLHAWIWLENPAGVFATDNWRLPYARLGHDFPRDAPAEAARALALAAGESGAAYVLARLRAIGWLTPEEAARAREVVLRYREEFRTVVASGRSELNARDLELLAEGWKHMREELGSLRPHLPRLGP